MTTPHWSETAYEAAVEETGTREYGSASEPCPLADWYAGVRVEDEPLWECWTVVEDEPVVEVSVRVEDGPVRNSPASVAERSA